MADEQMVQRARDLLATKYNAVRVWTFGGFLRVSTLMADFATAEQQRLHVAECNFPRRPMGAPGCICVVVCRARAADAIECARRLEELDDRTLDMITEEENILAEIPDPNCHGRGYSEGYIAALFAVRRHLQGATDEGRGDK